MSEVIVADLEANGFLDEADTIWCIATRSLQTRQEKFFGPDEIEEGLAYLSQVPVLVMHNSLGYDVPLIKKLYPDWVEPPMEDSLILSRLYNPDRQNGHSIEAWGKKLGRVKPAHDDWHEYSDAMKHRCIEDVRINCMMLRTLILEAGNHDWSDAIRTEYDAQRLRSEIVSNGFKLDIQRARRLYQELDDRMFVIEQELESKLPHRLKPGTTYLAPWTKAGKLKAALQSHIPESCHEDVAGPLSKVEFAPFNMNSPTQVVDFLVSQGWEPQFFNYKKAERGYELNDDGTYVVSTPRLPKADEDQSCIDTIRGDVGKQFMEYRVLKHRLGVLARVNQQTKKPAGWLNEVRKDGRLEAQAIVLGTNTGRQTHRVIVNVPAVYTPYGKELRSCLIAEDGYRLVGTDASGLEARVAGHFTAEFDGGAYATMLLEGDVHQANADAFSKAADKDISRNQAKTIYYALLYGAQARKVATEVGVHLEVGQEMMDAFWTMNPALFEVAEQAKAHAKKYGWVPGLDGRKVVIRSPHSAMNALFQSAGAQICKASFNKFHTTEPHGKILLDYHDEVCYELLPEHVDDHVSRWAPVGEYVTQKFNLLVPIEFESKVGANYAEVH